MIFSIATRDELWDHGVRLESRLQHGTARDESHRTIATDAPDEELIAAAESQLAALAAAAPRDARVRLVASAKRVAAHRLDEATMTVTRDGLSVVLDARRQTADSRPHLPRISSSLVSSGVCQLPSGVSSALPLLWRHGSASVLFHEAIGHAAEHGHARVDWPEWLSVHDEPQVPVDDTGAPARAADLLAEPPACFRRASFRDLPLRRMTNVVARQHRAPFELPPEYVEVQLVSGGRYEPLTGEVTVDVVVATVNGEPVAPFTVRASRDELARRLAGARGEPERYPGVICSSEGQELVVGSWAPEVLMR